MAGSFDQLVEALARSPGIGPKTARRLALFLLKLPREEALSLARSIVEAVERTRLCRACNLITDEEYCPICRDPRRDTTRILVLEEPAPLYVLEKTGQYRGLYHILWGALSPLNGVGPEALRLEGLWERVRAGGVEEVILATNPTTDGEATALYLSRELRPFGVRVTRIALGIPVGSELEFADEVTLLKSIEGRREMGD